MSEQNIIEFKGTKNGLFIHIKSQSDFDTIKQLLIEKLEKTHYFFSGAKISDIKCEALSLEEKEELETIMANRYKMHMEKKEMVLDAELKTETFKGIDEGNTKFIKGTIRSGQKIFYDGNLVILGDVNPGAEIIAMGNIVVMGALRGIAHAGADGNEGACVAAIYLDPTQLRIADVIARAPDGDYERPKNPEMARIKGNMVIIEPYLIKNSI